MTELRIQTPEEFLAGHEPPEPLTDHQIQTKASEIVSRLFKKRISVYDVDAILRQARVSFPRNLIGPPT